MRPISLRGRNRYQLNASISHYADEFLSGSHDFKAGIQTSNDPTRTHTGYTGGAFYIDYAGEPLYKYELPSQNDQPKNTTFAFFAQDAWTLAGDRLTINPGIRITSWQGTAVTDRGAATGIPAVTEDYGAAFKPKTGIAPRIGLTYDLLGDGTTALKGHYGKYYSQIITSMYLSPGESIFQGFFWNGDEYELDFTEFQECIARVGVAKYRAVKAFTMGQAVASMILNLIGEKTEEEGAGSRRQPGACPWARHLD